MITPLTGAYMRCADTACSKQYPLEEADFSCPSCGGLLDVGYSFSFPEGPAQMKDIFRARKVERTGPHLSGVWRFRELIPFVSDTGQIITLQEGNTPIYDAVGSSTFSGMAQLKFKHQGMNPTGSFKDNGMTTGVTRAFQLGVQGVACASTGNTSASMAAYAARAGLHAIVFIPAGQVSYGKLAQALEYGADILEIEGNFDDAMRIVREIASVTGIYLLNSVNPFRLEGQKTIVIEMLEQLDWHAPDWIVLPGGNLGNVSAFGKGLHELFTLGFLDRIPRMAVIQAKGAAPFYKLFSSADRSELVPEGHPSTLATAIRIGNPVSWGKALRALGWTNGTVEQVTENEIAEAKAIIGRDGIGCEPASAVTLAGVKKLVASRVILPEDDVVCVLTGNLLKDPGYTIEYHTGQLSLEKDGEMKKIMVTRANKPRRVAANKEAIRRLIGI
jgi:threonine synthase